MSRRGDFLLRRTDQGGGFVAQPGSERAYTHSLHRARRYATRDAAEADRCPENEVIVDLRDALPGGRP